MPRLISALFVLPLILMAVPAQAQSFGFGTGFGFGGRFDDDNPFGLEREDRFPRIINCMTDRQIRDAIAAEGYTNIALNVPHEGRVQVRGTRGGVVYLIDFNYCINEIKGIRELRAAQ